ncbi:MAG TPA: hypothetical protein VK720_00745, partial [Terracidiphilus sp.]|nr:hypothetical protein [Terracidiphilus sp.]
MTETVQAVRLRAPSRVPLVLALSGGALWSCGVALGLADLHQPAVVLRVLGLCVCAVATVFRSSLLAWTLVAMLGGVELGLDAPGIASQTHFL